MQNPMVWEHWADVYADWVAFRLRFLSILLTTFRRRTKRKLIQPPAMQQNGDGSPKIEGISLISVASNSVSERPDSPSTSGAGVC